MHEYLTTKELAELLRIKERKVYDLATSGKIPCTKATGKLLFPRAEIHTWLEGHSISSGRPTSMNRPNVFLGSHDPLLDWAIRESGCGIASYFDGSTDGLDRFAGGEGIAAGLHLFDSLSGQWNAPVVERRFAGTGTVLIEWAKRQRGLVMRPDEQSIRSIADLKGRKFAQRQPESGSQALFLQMLSDAGLRESDIESGAAVRTETDAALSVLEGKSEVCFGLQSVAVQYGLTFVPLVEERFDLLVDRRDWFQPPFQAFLTFCRSDAFRQRTGEVAGYDFRRFGSVQYNA